MEAINFSGSRQRKHKGSQSQGVTHLLSRVDQIRDITNKSNDGMPEYSQKELNMKAILRNPDEGVINQGKPIGCKTPNYQQGKQTKPLHRSSASPMRNQPRQGQQQQMRSHSNMNDTGGYIFSHSPVNFNQLIMKTFIESEQNENFRRAGRIQKLNDLCKQKEQDLTNFKHTILGAQGSSQAVQQIQVASNDQFEDTAIHADNKKVMNNLQKKFQKALLKKAEEYARLNPGQRQRTESMKHAIRLHENGQLKESVKKKYFQYHHQSKEVKMEYESPIDYVNQNMYHMYSTENMAYPQNDQSIKEHQQQLQQNLASGRTNSTNMNNNNTFFLNSQRKNARVQSAAANRRVLPQTTVSAIQASRIQNQSQQAIQRAQSAANNRRNIQSCNQLYKTSDYSGINQSGNLLSQLNNNKAAAAGVAIADLNSGGRQSKQSMKQALSDHHQQEQDGSQKNALELVEEDMLNLNKLVNKKYKKTPVTEPHLLTNLVGESMVELDTDANPHKNTGQPQVNQYSMVSKSKRRNHDLSKLNMLTEIEDHKSNSGQSEDNSSDNSSHSNLSAREGKLQNFTKNKLMEGMKKVMNKNVVKELCKQVILFKDPIEAPPMLVKSKMSTKYVRPNTMAREKRNSYDSDELQNVTKTSDNNVIMRKLNRMVKKQLTSNNENFESAYHVDQKHSLLMAQPLKAKNFKPIRQSGVLTKSNASKEDLEFAQMEELQKATNGNGKSRKNNQKSNSNNAGKMSAKKQMSVKNQKDEDKNVDSNDEFRPEKVQSTVNFYKNRRAEQLSRGGEQQQQQQQQDLKSPSLLTKKKTTKSPVRSPTRVKEDTGHHHHSHHAHHQHHHHHHHLHHNGPKNKEQPALIQSGSGIFSGNQYHPDSQESSEHNYANNYFQSQQHSSVLPKSMHSSPQRSPNKFKAADYAYCDWVSQLVDFHSQKISDNFLKEAQQKTYLQVPQTQNTQSTFASSKNQNLSGQVKSEFKAAQLNVTKMSLLQEKEIYEQKIKSIANKSWQGYQINRGLIDRDDLLDKVEFVSTEKLTAGINFKNDQQSLLFKNHVNGYGLMGTFYGPAAVIRNDFQACKLTKDTRMTKSTPNLARDLDEGEDIVVEPLTPTKQTQISQIDLQEKLKQEDQESNTEKCFDESVQQISKPPIMGRKAEDDSSRRNWYNIHIDHYLKAVRKQINYSIKQEIYSREDSQIEKASYEKQNVIEEKRHWWQTPAKTIRIEGTNRVNLVNYELEMLNCFKNEDSHQDRIFEETIRQRMPLLKYMNVFEKSEFDWTETVWTIENEFDVAFANSVPVVESLVNEHPVDALDQLPKNQLKIQTRMDILKKGVEYNFLPREYMQMQYDDQIVVLYKQMNDDNQSFVTPTLLWILNMDDQLKAAFSDTFCSPFRPSPLLQNLKAEFNIWNFPEFLPYLDKHLATQENGDIIQPDCEFLHTQKKFMRQAMRHFNIAICQSSEQFKRVTNQIMHNNQALSDLMDWDGKLRMFTERMEFMARMSEFQHRQALRDQGAINPNKEILQIRVQPYILSEWSPVNKMLIRARYKMQMYTNMYKILILADKNRGKFDQNGYLRNDDILEQFRPTNRQLQQKREYVAKMIQEQKPVFHTYQGLEIDQDRRIMKDGKVEVQRLPLEKYFQYRVGFDYDYPRTFYEILVPLRNSKQEEAPRAITMLDVLGQYMKIKLEKQMQNLITKSIRHLKDDDEANETFPYQKQNILQNVIKKSQKNTKLLSSQHSQKGGKLKSGKVKKDSKKFNQLNQFSSQAITALRPAKTSFFDEEAALEEAQINLKMTKYGSMRPIHSMKTKKDDDQLQINAAEIVLEDEQAVEQICTKFKDQMAARQAPHAQAPTEDLNLDDLEDQLMVFEVNKIDRIKTKDLAHVSDEQSVSLKSEQQNQVYSAQSSSHLAHDLQKPAFNFELSSSDSDNNEGRVIF